MFANTVVFVFLLMVSWAAAAPAADDFVLIKSNSFNDMLQHMTKREVAVDIAAAVDNEPVDKDYDMELAEVNVFRPVFRIRSSYLRRGG